MELVNVSRVVPVVDEYGLSLCSIVVVVEECENLEVKLFLKILFFYEGIFKHYNNYIRRINFSISKLSFHWKDF